jgi:F-type H+-transporting ATPase subunit gamma
MAGGLLEIRKKIGGVKNTRKITKAMQLVAASKMRQFQKRGVSARKYVYDLLNILENNMDSKIKSSFSQAPEEAKDILFVLYTSDKGLCGPLNTKIINGLFRSELWLGTPEENRKLMTIGRKSNDFAKNNSIPVTKHFAGIPEKLSNLDAIKVVDAILDYWKLGKTKRIVFVAPHYKNSFTFYPVLKTFLPFTAEMIQTNIGHLESRPFDSGKRDEYMLFEPNQEFVINKLHGQIVQALFMQSFLELKASEYSSRMMAMQSATDSADRIVSDLSLVYNKARQQAITQEIAELVGASDAISS